MENLNEETRYEVTEMGTLHLKELQTYIIHFESDIDTMYYTSVLASTLSDAKEKFEQKWSELHEQGCKVCWHPLFEPMGRILSEAEIIDKINEMKNE